VAAGRVAVVGAGLAGLAAAIDLADTGFYVEVFERSRLLGGRATSFCIDGIEVDNGQHVFLGCCTEFLRFVDRVGMSKFVRLQERFDALVLSRDGVASRLRAVGLPAPWHLVGSFLGYRHMAWPDKMRLARALTATGKQTFDGSFAQWLARHGQTEDALRSFWRPFFVPALNAPLEEVSAADGTFVMSTAFRNGANAACFGYATVPLAQVARRAAAQLGRVHPSMPVSGLSFAGSHGGLDGIVLADGQRCAFDAIVLAVTPPQLSRLAGDSQRIGLPPLDGYKAHPIVDVHLWHDRGHLGFDFAALLDSPLQWIFEKSSGYLCCSLSDAHEYLHAPASRVSQTCWDAITAALPDLRGATLLRSAVTRSPEATYLAPPAQQRPGPHTSFPNLAIAGSWTATGWPDTMESAVRSGRAAARVIAGALGGVAVVA
jgi:hydroxysqualene dehydroxylase